MSPPSGVFSSQKLVKRGNSSGVGAPASIASPRTDMPNWPE